MRERYEPPPLESGELAVHIVSDDGNRDHVLLLAHEGKDVRVREWHAGNWSTGPDISVISADALLRRLEDVVRRRRRVEPDLSVVRTWLGDAGR
jgi:hypothetical protein